MCSTLLFIAALAAIAAAAPVPASENAFDKGNIYTQYENLVSYTKSLIIVFRNKTYMTPRTSAMLRWVDSELFLTQI